MTPAVFPVNILTFRGAHIIPSVIPCTTKSDSSPGLDPSETLRAKKTPIVETIGGISQYKNRELKLPLKIQPLMIIKNHLICITNFTVTFFYCFVDYIQFIIDTLTKKN